MIDKVSGIHFNASEEMHTLGHLYESMLKEMRDSAGDSGEFYTPRAVVRFMAVSYTHLDVYKRQTSQLLTTGVDAPTCKNVVIVRIINSMSEFKQIIGRGTRIREDYGKLYFSILEYTGSATRPFADPGFDGLPEFAEDITMDAEGNTVSEVETTEAQDAEAEPLSLIHI